MKRVRSHPLFFWHKVCQDGCVKLVSMYEPLLNPSRSIRNKADAMQFAILTTLQYKCGENSKVNYEEAKKLFDFICDNVDFPVDEVQKMSESVASVINGFLTERG